jgi:hypothetical protein
MIQYLKLTRYEPVVAVLGISVKREDLQELHFICPIANVSSVFTHGILSHNQASKLPHESCAKQEIQDRRTQVVVPSGKPLHNYANVYFNARNPMMHLLKDDHTKLAVLVLDKNIIDLPGAIVTDRNASRDYAIFRPASTGLAMLDSNLIYAEYWTHSDPIEQDRRKGIRCAEVLVPDKIESHFIIMAYVSCEESRIILDKLLRVANVSLPIVVNGNLFFR